MSRQKTNLIFGVSALVIGALIYILFRSDTYISKIASKFLGIRNIQNRLSLLNSNLIKYYLPDFLWAFSLACMLQVSLKELSFGRMVSGFVAIACGVIWECLQALDVISGTGDLWDVAMYLLAGLLSIYINYKECRK